MNNDANLSRKSKQMKEDLSNDLKGSVSEEESRFWIRTFRDYENPWGYIEEVQNWLEHDTHWRKIQTLEDLRDKITRTRSYEPRHIRKVELAMGHLKDEGIKYVP